MTTNRAYLIIPKLIEQPTWGGHYIMQSKGWEGHPDADKKFGQSYELFSGSHASLATDTADRHFQPEIDHIPEQAFPLEQVRSESPEQLLGSRGVQKFNGELKTLIKFTQAQGNSFQLHVKQPAGDWLPKPESWYFFEKGLATLGITDTKQVAAYKKTCEEINAHIISLTEKIDPEHPETLKQARMMAAAFIKRHNPYRFVHTVTVPANTVVAIHQGGIHHSWEEDAKKIPNGNIVYEVQVDVMDNVSTLRSFDKGKIQDDGTIRPLTIDEYFAHLDTSDDMNDPKKLMQTPQKQTVSESLSVAHLFDTEYYQMDEMNISAKLRNEHTHTKNETFHHVFVREGSIDYHDGSIDLSVGQGHALFIPAAVGQYTLEPKEQQAVVLKTYI